MDPKLEKIVGDLTDEQREDIALRDALLASFKVSVAGVDVTHWTPQLAPELAQKKAREPGPPGEGALPTPRRQPARPQR